jgi:hypothetical protein
MALDASLLDDAYALYAEFGPALKTPRRERLRTKYSSLSEIDLDALMLAMEKVSVTVWALAECSGDKSRTEGMVEARLQTEHPFLCGIGLARAKFLVNYYAWHEGWEK